MAECYRDVKIPAHSYPVADKVIIVEMVELVRYIRTRFLKEYHKDVGILYFFISRICRFAISGLPAVEFIFFHFNAFLFYGF